MNAAELIRKKRNGKELDAKELEYLIGAYVSGEVPDYQMSAFLMACYFRGMTPQETITLTRLMLYSGRTIDLSDIPGLKVDKHSTGGVGDKVSLILAPIVASCGIPVPMISGRGLGHTGGTLDKLESIPGFRTSLSIEEYRDVIKKVGVVMIGQTNEIVPADKKMYALRDVTATVECIPLIAGSIMSKKLAEGIDALVLDIKTGRGAFMQKYTDARELGKTLVAIGNDFGKETIGFLTDMNQPLGTAIGNWLEVVESVECLAALKGVNDGSTDLMEVTHVLSGAMIMLGKKAASLEEGIEQSREAVSSGRALEKFKQMVTIQGGDRRVIEQLDSYPKARCPFEVRATTSGYVTAIDSLELGMTGIALGAGRQRVDDRIDPKAGMILEKKIGDSVGAGEIIVRAFTDRDDAVESAQTRIHSAFAIRETRVIKPALIHEMISRDGIQSWNKA
ncbi:MAG: thymidine phosphorylase [Ignavibacteria bacterium]|nr:thymidine phosphorylase [Ignavibacteria bacterium]